MNNVATIARLVARAEGSIVPGTNLTVEQYCDNLRSTSPKPYDLPNYDPTTDICNPYKYVPSAAWGWTSVALFGIATLIHFYQTIRSRRWWLFNFVAGGILETLGWVGRGIGHSNIYSKNAFIIQICCLIIAPAFYSAAIYGILGWVITALGPKYSLIRPNRYWMIFITGDVVSLVIQGIGGGVASAGSNQDDANKLKLGSNIMLAGIIIQLLVMVIFSIFAIHFYNRFRKSTLPPFVKSVKGLEKIHLLGYALVIGSLAIILRGIYRVIELAEGWRGFLMLHEFYFLFDMLPCIICMLIFILWAPLYTLPRGLPTANDLAYQAGVPLPYPVTSETEGVKAAKLEEGQPSPSPSTLNNPNGDWNDEKGLKK